MAPKAKTQTDKNDAKPAEPKDAVQAASKDDPKAAPAENVTAADAGEATTKEVAKLSAEVTKQASAESQAPLPSAKTNVEVEDADKFVLISTTHKKSRRRAGMSFTPEGVRVDVTKLDAKQKEAIQSDPYLKVSPITE
ncbi:hypothetical protein [Cognatishimia sp. MH4019]|uniref:hypothetical protein n=1 Tax=Cognatishimia sp. MH4019 TaxID=2854030 RepID=UPI001CD19AA6|nr:hypothetical protein [Cognatishimia sp. MH4019]